MLSRQTASVYNSNVTRVNLSVSPLQCIVATTEFAFGVVSIATTGVLVIVLVTNSEGYGTSLGSSTARVQAYFRAMGTGLHTGHTSVKSK